MSLSYREDAISISIEKSNQAVCQFGNLAEWQSGSLAEWQYGTMPSWQSGNLALSPSLCRGDRLLLIIEEMVFLIYLYKYIAMN